MEVKNYRINFMDDVHGYLTAKQAADVFSAWNSGSKAIVVNGNAYAVHQIKNIVRIDREEEETKYGELTVPEFFMSTHLKNQLNDQKLLT